MTTTKRLPPNGAKFTSMRRLMDTASKREMSVVGNWLLEAKDACPDAEAYIADAGWGNEEGGSPGIVIIVKDKFYDEAMNRMPFLERTYIQHALTYPVYYRRGDPDPVPFVPEDPSSEPMFEGEFDFGFEVT